MANPQEIEAKIQKRKAFRMARNRIIKQKQRLGWVEKFIDCAEEDLRSSKILHEAKLYPRSIYLLQQGVEKLAKADYLILSIFEDKIEKIEGHNSIERIIKSM
jgi:hypothetical protein